MDFNDKRRLDTSRVKVVKPQSRGQQLIRKGLDFGGTKPIEFAKEHIAGPSDHVSEGRRDKSRALQNAAKRKLKNS